MLNNFKSWKKKFNGQLKKLNILSISPFLDMNKFLNILCIAIFQLIVKIENNNF